MRRVVCLTVWALVVGPCVGCSTRRDPRDEPMRYHSTAELKARLEDVAKYGDGGSSLGGIPESIQELTRHDPEKGKQLLEDFRRLDTVNTKEERREIAKQMAAQLP